MDPGCFAIHIITFSASDSELELHLLSNLKKILRKSFAFLKDFSLKSCYYTPRFSSEPSEKCINHTVLAL